VRDVAKFEIDPALCGSVEARLVTRSHCTAGGLSRGLATVLLSPVTLVKTRLEATGSFGLSGTGNMFTVARDVIKVQGIRGLWTGCIPAVLSNAPFSAIYYSVYSQCQKTAIMGAPQPLINFAAGMLGAMVATVVTQPTDVLRARVQLGAATGLWSAAKTAVQSESVPRTFMTGAMPRFLKRTIQTALIWTLYEEIMPVVYRILADQRSDVKRVH
jgi:solute carrier family 25, member 38